MLKYAFVICASVFEESRVIYLCPPSFCKRVVLYCIFFEGMTPNLAIFYPPPPPADSQLTLWSDPPPSCWQLAYILDRPPPFLRLKIVSKMLLAPILFYANHISRHFSMRFLSLCDFYNKYLFFFGKNHYSNDKMTVCRCKKRCHWSKTSMKCFYHQIPRLSTDTWARPSPPFSGRQLIYGWPLRTQINSKN